MPLDVRGCSFEDYLASRTIRSAVGARVTTIGEAMGVLLKIAPNVVWTVIQQNLPTLLREVRALLA